VVLNCQWAVANGKLAVQQGSARAKRSYSCNGNNHTPPEGTYIDCACYGAKSVIVSLPILDAAVMRALGDIAWVDRTKSSNW
jgi:hypothetical protein